MALPTTSETREFANFADNGDGTTSRYTVIKGGLGTLLAGVEFDSIVATYPSAESELYTYKLGGVSGTTKATIAVEYTDSTKVAVDNVVKTVFP